MSDAPHTRKAPAGKLSDQVQCHGVILFTERFEDCVAFYHQKLGLPLWYEKPGLCCLHFGSGYLMIERGGVGKAARKGLSENPTILRFNVADVAAAARSLAAEGIAVDIKHHSWGTTGAFLDPDGNVCGLKNADDPYFLGTAPA